MIDKLTRKTSRCSPQKCTAQSCIAFVNEETSNLSYPCTVCCMCITPVLFFNTTIHSKFYIFSPNCMCKTFFFFLPKLFFLTDQLRMELINCDICYELRTIIPSLKMNLFDFVMMLEILSMSSQNHATGSLRTPVLCSSFSNSFHKIHFQALYFMDEVCLYSLYSINFRLSSVFFGYGLIRVERHAVDILISRENVK